MKTLTAPSVFGWAADSAGCGYYRIGLPFSQLREQYGIKCAAAMEMPKAAQAEADVIVGQRVCQPGPTETWQKLSNAGRHLVFEIDDDLWHVHPENKKPFEFFTPERKANLSKNVRAATVVTVTNENLANVVGEFNDNVVILPNMIDASLLEWERPQREHLTIGWSGSFTHNTDFKLVSTALTKFFASRPNLDMQFIGHDYSKMIGKPDSLHMDWVELVSEYQRMINFDIGIIPLKHDQFNKSKSYIKALEYAALGIPVVASDAGPYRNFVQHGVTGFLVNNKSDIGWEKYLNLLINDRDLRESMGEAAKELATKHTIQGNAIKWLQTYSGLMGVNNDQLEESAVG